jgi:hypothetical protein
VNCHDDMDCEKAFRLLDGYLDRSLNEEDRAQLGRLQAPPELMDRIRAHLDQLASGS